VPLTSTVKGKEVVVESTPSTARVRVAPTSVMVMASLGGGVSSRGPPDSGGAQPPSCSKKRKRQASTHH
jgi:hypothetical protein